MHDSCSIMLHESCIETVSHQVPPSIRASLIYKIRMFEVRGLERKLKQTSNIIVVVCALPPRVPPPNPHPAHLLHPKFQHCVNIDAVSLEGKSVLLRTALGWPPRAASSLHLGVVQSCVYTMWPLFCLGGVTIEIISKMHRLSATDVAQTAAPAAPHL
jgi:hypothetical protein